VGVFRPIVQIAVLPVFHARQYLPLGGLVAFELIGDDHPWDIPAAFEELAEERLRGVLVPPALHQDIEDMTILIDGPPEIVPLTTNGEKDFIQIPLITWLRAPVTELIGIRLPEFPAPLPDRFVRDDDAAGKQQLFNIAIAEAEPEIEPDRVADDLGREAMILVWVCWRGGFHRANMPHRAEPV
jgi:hypothetical protein